MTEVTEEEEEDHAKAHRLRISGAQFRIVRLRTRVAVY